MPRETLVTVLISATVNCFVPSPAETATLHCYAESAQTCTRDGCRSLERRESGFPVLKVDTDLGVIATCDREGRCTRKEVEVGTENGIISFGRFAGSTSLTGKVSLQDGRFHMISYASFGKSLLAMWGTCQDAFASQPSQERDR